MSMFLASLGALGVSCGFTPYVISKLAIPHDRTRRVAIILGMAYATAVVAGYLIVILKGLYTLESPFYGVIYNVFGLLFMMHVYLTFLAVPLSVILLFPSKVKSSCKVVIGALSVILSAGFVIYGFARAQNYDVVEWTITSPKVTSPVTFAHLPDIHLGHQRGSAYLNEVLQSVEKHNPDFILYNGDLFDSNAGLTPAIAATLAAVKTPQYFTLGNHEHYMDTPRSLEMLEAAGVRVLRSEIVEIKGAQLVGLEYMNADAATRDPHSVNDLSIDVELPKLPIDKSRLVIVAHHSPAGIQYVTAAGADLYVAGHTHAGQVFPATFLIKYTFPFFKGLMRDGNNNVLVSEGVGTFGPWMRLGSRNEAQIIRITPEP